MKSLIIMLACLCLPGIGALAQAGYRDKSVRYQQERMVSLQWDKNKFSPDPGFLSLNPYYWLVWGLFHPNYHQTDRRPLSPGGPQTQRLALVAALNATDNSYKLQSDTVRNTALSEIANQSGLVSGADPLWQLYYKRELDPVINHSPAGILGSLPPRISARLVEEGLYAWYKNELDMLKERIDAAHSTTLDRGARIMAYHRYLMEYRNLAAIWAVRTSAAAKTIEMTAQNQRLRSGDTGVANWSSGTDIAIARQVLTRVQ